MNWEMRLPRQPDANEQPRTAVRFGGIDGSPERHCPGTRTT
jgi:hypothetical protein